VPSSLLRLYCSSSFCDSPSLNINQYSGHDHSLGRRHVARCPYQMKLSTELDEIPSQYPFVSARSIRRLSRPSRCRLLVNNVTDVQDSRQKSVLASLVDLTELFEYWSL
jgi:hypothetical protein